ncbi:tetratricopeptide repeat protein, partial [Pectobacterium brasiliense]|uniref:tetratricopeptide repeat protein n=2 Tax=Pectobacterium brasiliense TaxID=180957 RepID=UPI00300DDAD0
MKILSTAVIFLFCFFSSLYVEAEINRNEHVEEKNINEVFESIRNQKYINESYDKSIISLDKKIGNFDTALSSLKDNVSRIDAYSSNVMVAYNFLTWFIPLAIVVLSLISIPFFWNRTKMIHKDAIDKWIKDNEGFLIDESKKEFLNRLTEKYEKLVDEIYSENEKNANTPEQSSQIKKEFDAKLSDGNNLKKQTNSDYSHKGKPENGNESSTQSQAGVGTINSDISAEYTDNLEVTKGDEQSVNSVKEIESINNKKINNDNNLINKIDISVEQELSGDKTDAYQSLITQLNDSTLPKEEVAAYQEFIEQFSDSDVPEIQTQLAMAYRSMGIAYEQLNQPEEEIATYRKLIERFGDSDHPAIQEQLAMAYRNMGITYGQLNQPEEKIAVY